MDDKIAIKARISQAREQAGINKSTLARALGVHSSAAIQWESESGGLPKLEHMVGLAKLTGVNFEWLATGRGNMKHSPAGSQVAEPTGSYMSQAEMELINMFRKIPVSKRDAIKDFIKSMSGK